MKRKWLLLALVFGLASANASNYYISNQGNDNNNGRSAATPWRTLDEVNAYGKIFTLGDSIFFKRGEVFYGSLRIVKNGTQNNHIYIGAYGEGAAPVLSGFKKITSWTSIGNNRYESTESVPVNSLEMLTVDDVQYGRGRYPNRGSSNNGWLVVGAKSTTSITEANNALSSNTNNWTGATVVIRPTAYLIECREIMGHSGSTINFSAATSPVAGYGFFIQDDIRTLDQHGEWYFNPTTKKVTIFTKSNPDNYTIKVSAQDTVIQCYNDDYIDLENLTVEGANKWGIFYYSSVGSTIKNCTIRFCGYDGVRANTDVSDFTVHKNIIYDCNDYGINTDGSGNNKTITYNTVYNVGLFAGMGSASSSRHLSGIFTNSGTGQEVCYNTVYNIGYQGIRVNGDNINVSWNVIHDFCKTVDDGAGLYSYDGSKKYMGKKVCSNNLIYNGVGAPEGANGNNRANGLYLDDGSSYWTVTGNSVFGVGKYGFYMHNGEYNNVYDNLFYDAGKGGRGVSAATENQGAAFINRDRENNSTAKGTVALPMTNVVFKNNICFAKYENQNNISFESLDNTPKGYVNGGSDIDSNYYIKPGAAGLSPVRFIPNTANNSKQHLYTLSDWKTFTGFDANSVVMPVRFSAGTKPEDKFLLMYNTGLKDSTVILQRSYSDGRGKKYSAGEFVLAPRSAIVFIKPE